MNEPFSAWKMGAPYYVPLLGVGGILTVTLAPYGLWWIGAIVLSAGAFVLYFFRDPKREIPTDPRAVVSPADGTVVAIEELDESPHYDGPCKRISIFLSVFSVHVNRAPFDSLTEKVLYRPGRYINAMSAESSQVNESNAIWLSASPGAMTVRQISGAVARRIVCLPEVGNTLTKGQKIGMIKFGSRTELYLPPSVEICVALKQKVRGGSSIVARVHQD